MQQSYTMAAFWFRLAAHQGFARSQLALGTLYQHGHGVSQNNVKSYFWFALAAKNHNKIAARNLKRIAQLMTPAQIAEAQTLIRHDDNNHQ